MQMYPELFWLQRHYYSSVCGCCYVFQKRPFIFKVLGKLKLHCLLVFSGERWKLMLFVLLFLSVLFCCCFGFFFFKQVRHHSALILVQWSVTGSCWLVSKRHVRLVFVIIQQLISNGSMNGKHCKAERRLQELYGDYTLLMQICAQIKFVLGKKVVQILLKLLKVHPTYTRPASDPLSGHSLIHWCWLWVRPWTLAVNKRFIISLHGSGVGTVVKNELLLHFLIFPVLLLACWLSHCSQHEREILQSWSRL